MIMLRLHNEHRRPLSPVGRLAHVAVMNRRLSLSLFSRCYLFEHRSRALLRAMMRNGWRGYDASLLPVLIDSRVLALIKRRSLDVLNFFLPPHRFFSAMAFAAPLPALLPFTNPLLQA